jgi:hypothetical protein
MSDPNQTPPNPTPGTPSQTPPPSSDPPSNEPPIDPNAPPSEAPKSPLTEEKPPAPEPFEADKLTLPEGMEKNEIYDEFTNFAKEAGFKHSDAQKALDLAAKAIKANLDASNTAWYKQQTEWLEAIKKDSELGPNLEVDTQTFAKVADNRELSDPDFRKALDFTGAGTHPAIVRTLIRWSKALSEGGLVAGNPAERNRQGGTVPSDKTMADRLYPGGPHTGGPKLS